MLCLLFSLRSFVAKKSAPLQSPVLFILHPSSFILSQKKVLDPKVLTLCASITPIKPLFVNQFPLVPQISTRFPPFSDRKKGNNSSYIKQRVFHMNTALTAPDLKGSDTSPNLTPRTSNFFVLPTSHFALRTLSSQRSQSSQSSQVTLQTDAIEQWRQASQADPSFTQNWTTHLRKIIRARQRASSRSEIISDLQVNPPP